jgi:hypothetical protein
VMLHHDARRLFVNDIGEGSSRNACPCS